MWTKDDTVIINFYTAFYATHLDKINVSDECQAQGGFEGLLRQSEGQRGKCYRVTYTRPLVKGENNKLYKNTTERNGNGGMGILEDGGHQPP